MSDEQRDKGLTRILYLEQENDRLDTEVERLRARIGRLRKAVNWLRGALHDDAPGHQGTHAECGVWECMRARVVLEEALDLDRATSEDKA